MLDILLNPAGASLAISLSADPGDDVVNFVFQAGSDRLAYADGNTPGTYTSWTLTESLGWSPGDSIQVSLLSVTP